MTDLEGQKGRVNCPQYGSELSLEEQSFRNVVYFYWDELTAIMGGASGHECFTTNVRGSLYRKGILFQVGRGKARVQVSAPALEILEAGPVEGSLTPHKEGFKVIPVHQRALGISEDLEKISDRNLACFYREEIRAGSVKSIPIGPRRRLREAGIVGVQRGKGLIGSKVYLTPYGAGILKEDLGHTILPTF